MGEAHTYGAALPAAVWPYLTILQFGIAASENGAAMPISTGNKSHRAIYFPAYSFLAPHTLIREVFSIEVKQMPEVNKNLTSTKEINVTIHYADDGPTLTSCMISIVSSHMSKNANF